MNAIELREEDLRSVLFNFEEALEKISLLKEELPKMESKLKKILEDSKEMVTLEEFEKKHFKGNYLKDFSYHLNESACEFYQILSILTSDYFNRS
ncbi:hypothetical protein F7P74_06185 [Helicobacter pullorum NCTC 12824]|uniref:hypothetical protein n=1 Tax=Helicobacter pullorum TaxID=35818 RepID=UPI0012467A93|nr:hypothetical protein [Helicobacter pullorum]KAB0574519.1 hypothetical protein F7P74_06185 [Helicobacter pullorum NCTC 12824]